MRVAVLVDGFNLYHSLCDAIEDGAAMSLKWLDIRKLCAAQLSAFNDTNAALGDLYYFTSLANYHADQSKVSRHKTYVKALESTGFTTTYGTFYGKKVKCEADCHKEYTANVEKQTDVNIAIKLLEVFQNGSAEAAFIVSGDSDLTAAVKTAQVLFPDKVVAVAFPYKRWNPELSKHAKVRVKLDIDLYKAAAFPHSIPLGGGNQIKIPKDWVNPVFVIKK